MRERQWGPKVLQVLEVHRAIPALKAVPGDVLIVWNDGTTDVNHSRRSDPAAVAQALATGAVTPLDYDDREGEPGSHGPPHRLHLVEG